MYHASGKDFNTYFLTNIALFNTKVKQSFDFYSAILYNELMKIIPLSKLAETEFTTTALYAERQFWAENARFSMKEPRKRSALLWFCGCEGKCVLKNGKEIPLPRNALAYIPQSSVYTLHFFHKTEPCATLLLEFCLTADEPFCLRDEVTVLDIIQSDHKIVGYLQQLADDFSMLARPFLHIKSTFYRLMTRLCAGAEIQSLDSSGVRIIEQGIRYLQQDQEQALSIEEIAKTCFVSANYFRRLFEKYAGVSPNEYRAARKIERAKLLLENSELSVVEISDTLHYSSAAYFCRCFKKRTGITPMEYRERMKGE